MAEGTIADLEKALADAEAILGPSHPHTVEARTKLALAYKDVDRYDEAVPLMERLVADAEAELGPYHDDTTNVRAQLGSALVLSGRNQPAIPHLEMVLTRYTELGLIHLHGSRAMLGLALLRVKRHDEAAQTFEHILADGEQTDVILALKARDFLADTYQELGRTADALTQREAALQGYERECGPDHDTTLASRIRLARAYRDADRAAQALPLFEQVAVRREAALGPHALGTLAARRDVAKIRLALGRVEDAVVLFQQLFDDRMRILRSDGETSEGSRDAIEALDDLVTAQERARDDDAAIDGLRRLLEARIEFLGADHLTTMVTRHRLADVLARSRRFDEAIEEYAQVLEDRERVLGTGHSHTWGARHGLGAAYRLADLPGRAVPVLEQALAERVAALGPGDPYLVSTRRELAQALTGLQEYDAAVIQYEAVVAGLQHDASRVVPARNDLVVALGNADRHHESYEVAARTLRLSEQVFGPDHDTTATALWNFAVNASATCRFEESVPALDRLLEIRGRTVEADDPTMFNYRGELAAAYAGIGDYGRSLELARQILDESVRVFGPDHERTRRRAEDLIDPPRCWSHRPELTQRRQWQVALAAPLSERDVGTTHTSLYPAAWLVRRRSQEALGGGWGVTTPDDLADRLRRLAEAGHRVEIEKECGHQPLAWDMARYAHILRLGVACGLVGEEAAWEYLEEITEMTSAGYPSWREFADDFLLGRAAWLGIVGAPPERWPLSQRRAAEAADRLLDPAYARSPWNAVAWDEI
jgi:tetratricopeptide (TPR) repeat protein